MTVRVCKQLRFWVLAAGLGAIFATTAHAGDIRINLPKRAESTPVQRLNREGVEAVQKRNYEKARTLFYRAYLLDPDDPFTLNNLGFIAEIDGQVDRAQKFYTLAAGNMTEATVELASARRVEGETFKTAVAGRIDAGMEINRGNFRAIQLLSQNRALEAELELNQTLQLDKKNAFTLNNLGVTKEMEGDYDAAERYYHAVATSGSNETVVVTFNGSSRGKPVSQVATNNSQRLRDRLKNEDPVEGKVSRLNFQGVQAVNRNDWKTAEKDFLEAYRINPYNGFVLNNLGFVSEMEGDPETAQIFYERAQIAQDASARVGTATKLSATGKRLLDVAQVSNSDVDKRIAQLRELRRRQPGAVVLKHRDNTPVVEPSQPPQ